MSMRQKRVPIEALERIDELCAEFERKWRTNERPSIESVVAGEVQRDVLLAEIAPRDSKIDSIDSAKSAHAVEDSRRSSFHIRATVPPRGFGYSHESFSHALAR